LTPARTLEDGRAAVYNAGMLILAACTHCQTEHELSENLLGKTVSCPQCREPFLVQEIKRHEAATFAVQSDLAHHELVKDWLPPATSPSRKTSQDNSRHNLVLSSPPREQWTGGKSKKGDTEKFPIFDPYARDVEDFLEREKGVDDYSWLLMVGLILSTVLIVTFLGWLVYLIVVR
jgi:hypothetical protein